MIALGIGALALLPRESTRIDCAIKNREALELAAMCMGLEVKIRVVEFNVLAQPDILL